MAGWGRLTPRSPASASPLRHPPGIRDRGPEPSTLKADVSAKSCALLLVPLLSGCGFSHAPSIAIAGSYFPAWMLCTVIALIATVLIRVILVRTGLDDRMPWRVAAYAALALALTFALLLLAFSR